MGSTQHDIAAAAPTQSFTRGRRRHVHSARRPRRRGSERLRVGREAVAVGLLVALLFGCVLIARTPEPSVEYTTSVRIAPGDSLWRLARAHPIPGLDTASTVDVIRRLNRLDSASLVVGSTLRVPSEPRAHVASR